MSLLLLVANETAFFPSKSARPCYHLNSSVNEYLKLDEKFATMPVFYPPITTAGFPVFLNPEWFVLHCRWNELSAVFDTITE
ncbi:hypothetical protein CEXT_152891 [Caerostris extrusa]|uniref:Uncharacterized protein n=1 Tax=Caerostris extrusa TaxID=172846 RepID=A0AAV4U0M1_CAEEX|nr:hypothetical protein CEXT_152891 [Caerostris extrusa]